MGRTSGTNLTTETKIMRNKLISIFLFYSSKALPEHMVYSWPLMVFYFIKVSSC